MANQYGQALYWLTQSMEQRTRRPTVDPLVWEIAFNCALALGVATPSIVKPERFLELLHDGLVSETADLGGEKPRQKLKRLGWI